MTIDWSFLLTFTSIAIIGIFIGTFLNHVLGGQNSQRIWLFHLSYGTICVLYELLIHGLRLIEITR